MKFLATLACVLASASAFTAPTMTFAVGKKAPAKKAAKTKPVPAPKKAAPKPKPAPKKAAPKPKPAPKKAAPKPKPAPKKAAPKPKPAPKPRVAAASVGVVPSAAIPGEVAPALLDGSLVGDVGFDPCFLTTKADSAANYFNGIFGTNLDGISWYREAELMHGRIAMVAAVGFIVPGFFHWPGSSATGFDAYNFPNPLDAWTNIPDLAAAQVATFLIAMEFRRINIILKEGNSYQAGASQKWGQGGAGFYNPFNFDYTPAEYEEKQLQEIKHARLAMIGLLGLYLQANISGVGVVEQWATAFTAPDYYAKAGYFLPQGI